VNADLKPHDAETAMQQPERQHDHAPKNPALARLGVRHGWPAEPESLEGRLGRLLSHAPAWAGSAGAHAVLILLLMQVAALRVGELPKNYQVGLAPPRDSKLLDSGRDILDKPMPAEEPATIDPSSFRWDESQTQSGELFDKIAATDDYPKLVALYGNYGARSKGGRADAVKRGGGSSGSERAVELALEWLERHQGTDGGWHATTYRERCIAASPCKDVADPLRNVDAGLTALATLAFLGAGNTDAQGRFEATVGRALGYLLRIQSSDGCFGPKFGTESIYNHAICTLAMSEASGMTQNERFKASAEKGVAYSLKVQHTDGGWGYVRESLNTYLSDVSVTGWQAMALKSAELAGIAVPKTAWSNLMNYIEQTSDEQGMSGYAAANQFVTPMNRSTIAVGMVCRQFAPERPDPAKLAAIAGYLAEHAPSSKHEGFFYYAYYGSLGLYQYGGPKWEAWNSRAREMLVHAQCRQGCAAGSWDPGLLRWASWAGRIYSTSLSALTLEVYYRYLPIHRGSAAENETPEAAVLRAYKRGLEAYWEFAKLSDDEHADAAKLADAAERAVDLLKAGRAAETAFDAPSAESKEQEFLEQRLTRLAATAIRLATVCLKTKRYAECVEEVNDFAVAYPGYEDQETPRKLYAGALALLARRLNGEGEAAKAASLRRAAIEEDYRRLVADPEQPLNFYMRVAEDFYAREDWWRGASVYAAIFSKFAGEPEVKGSRHALMFRLGRCLLKSGELTPALKIFEELRDAASSRAVLAALADCLIQAKKPEEALAAYLRLREACELGSPDRWEAELNVAGTLLLLGRVEECEQLIGYQKLSRPDLGGEALKAKFEELLRACGKVGQKHGANERQDLLK